MKRIALVGNPNVGKSVVFNELTGMNQKVANFPRCTVEKKIGHSNIANYKAEIVDLPGIYSFTAQSMDELVTRQFLIDEKLDLILNIVDASNLERNLYLTLQLIEMQIPMILILNMMDVARGKGIQIDVTELNGILGIPVIPITATKRYGIDELIAQISQGLTNEISKPKRLEYSKALEKEIKHITTELRHCSQDHRCTQHTRWLAIKIIENDLEARTIQNNNRKVSFSIEKMENRLDVDDTFLFVADNRYKKIESLIKNTVQNTGKDERTVSDLLDDVLTNNVVGLPIFFVILWLMFNITFNIGDPFVKLLEIVFHSIRETNTDLFGQNILVSFVNGVIIDGLGSVITFVPNLLFLFLGLAILEDTGYLSRASFNLDRAMKKIGLHGESVIPMLIGVGCNVPAIVSTRAMRNEKDRLLTILVIPFVSCSARLPVFVLFTSALFVNHEPSVIIFLYLLSILLVVFSSFVLRRALFEKTHTPYLLELPPYFVPELKTIRSKTQLRLKMFLKKAGKIIFVAITVIWLLDRFNLIKPIGEIIKVIFFPLSLDWQLAAALLFGIVAKEIIIGSLGSLYNIGNTEVSLTTFLATSSPFAGNPAAALAYLVFILLYVPCFATLGVIRQETNSWYWTSFAAIYSTFTAYLTSLLVFLIYPYINILFT